MARNRRILYERSEFSSHPTIDFPVTGTFAGVLINGIPMRFMGPNGRLHGSSPAFSLRVALTHSSSITNAVYIDHCIDDVLNLSPQYSGFSLDPAAAASVGIDYPVYFQLSPVQPLDWFLNPGASNLAAAQAVGRAVAQSANALSGELLGAAHPVAAAAIRPLLHLAAALQHLNARVVGMMPARAGHSADIVFVVAYDHFVGTAADHFLPVVVANSANWAAANAGGSYAYVIDLPDLLSATEQGHPVAAAQLWLHFGYYNGSHPDQVNLILIGLGLRRPFFLVPQCVINAAISIPTADVNILQIADAAATAAGLPSVITRGYGPEFASTFGMAVEDEPLPMPQQQHLPGQVDHQLGWVQIEEEAQVVPNVGPDSFTSSDTASSVSTDLAVTANAYAAAYAPIDF